MNTSQTKNVPHIASWARQGSRYWVQLSDNNISWDELRGYSSWICLDRVLMGIIDANTIEYFPENDRVAFYFQRTQKKKLRSLGRLPASIPLDPSLTPRFEFQGNVLAKYELHRRVWAAFGDVSRDCVEPRIKSGMPAGMIKESRPDGIELWRDFCPLAVGDLFEGIEVDWIDVSISESSFWWDLFSVLR